jgi:DNA-binding transcriptional MerR regulator/effector-binding domain-containing protein
MQRLTIGAFSRLTHLSIKTLRYYHREGLLEPTDVDPDSGYRYYRPEQAREAQVVRRFRDLGMPVSDVKAVLAAPDLTARDAILASHLDRMRNQLRQTEAAIDSLQRLLDGAPTAFAIAERVLPGAVTVSVSESIPRSEIAGWWWESLLSLRSVASQAGLVQIGPAGGLYDDELFTEEKGNARVYLPVRETAGLARMDARWDLPAGRYAVTLHTGAHDDADRAYAAVGAYAGEAGRDSIGPVRELYLVSALDTPDAARWQTEICWPLASADAVSDTY